jgi:hypothetical protein
MTPSGFGRSTLGLIVAAAMLTGCGASQASGVTGAMPQILAIGTYADRGTSWMLPEAKNENLLYLAAPGEGISVLSYPRGKLLQTLDTYDWPQGLCSDRDGNVWVALPLNLSVAEYAHGGSSPIATLADPREEPLGCAVDPRSGDLAVASALGSIQVYSHASGSAQSYKLYGVKMLNFCTYDDKGNLFADGESNSGTFELIELPNGGSSLRKISIDATLSPDYAIAWYGKDLAVQASEGSGGAVIDSISINGSTGSVVETTTLDIEGNPHGAQFTLFRRKVILPEDEGVGVWKYPLGGDPIKTFSGLGKQPFLGATVSAIKS